MIPKEFIHKHMVERKVPNRPLALFELVTLPKSITKSVLRVFCNFPFPHNAVPTLQKSLKKGYGQSNIWGFFKRNKSKMMNQGYVLLAVYSDGVMCPTWIPKDEIDSEFTAKGIHPENATDGQLAGEIIDFAMSAFKVIKAEDLKKGLR